MHFTPPTVGLHVCSLMLRKISKIGATRCQILRLKRTKFSAGALLQTPQGSLRCSFISPKAVLLRNGGEREEKKGEGKER